MLAVVGLFPLGGTQWLSIKSLYIPLSKNSFHFAESTGLKVCCVALDAILPLLRFKDMGSCEHVLHMMRYFLRISLPSSFSLRSRFKFGAERCCVGYIYSLNYFLPTSSQELASYSTSCSSVEMVFLYWLTWRKSSDKKKEKHKALFFKGATFFCHSFGAEKLICWKKNADTELAVLRWRALTAT